MMNSLIRKVWESVSNRSGSSSIVGSSYLPGPNPISDDDRLFQMMSLQCSSTGHFDRIPIDVFMRIVKFMGPKDAARLTAVCKTWKILVSDNRLWIYFLQNQAESWDSIFFAETHLRSGYPFPAFPTQMHELSFMHIYGQRFEAPGAVIIDGGSGYCKYGWSKYPSPSGWSATFLEFGNIESPMSSRLRHFFSTICSRMQVKTSSHPIVLSLPLCHYDATESAKRSRRQLKEAIYSTLFDMNVPAVCTISQATLALFAAKRTSGIVVNVGFHQTTIVPILRGKVMRNIGVEVVGIGALKLTSYLRDRLQRNNVVVDSLYTVRTLKEKLCYVALDYEAELQKDTQASFSISPGSCFSLSKERFQTGEILFQPRLAGMQAMGLHNAVSLCMEHCHYADLTGDDNWYRTVVLAGGTACLPGLAERLEKELNDLLQSTPMRCGVCVIPPPHGPNSAWFGAKFVSNLSSFPNAWCVTKKQFRNSSKRKLLW